ncbi:ArsR/SmtB family transcription factor [Enterococcus gallinarum]|uniref:ArsR/SmtB family transcription factor n=1 Tax=Enterococcus gallinarum TaxID=1353 RepID=UPI00288FD00E|nr:metalloregulator ArsR/SmtB family transcription factor [Enterococcus gallinarum]MDT2680485.1 metalloregulator ArsR/SmtB family transcription factor [Enterococcus gallinarum]MDT2683715.1 metalloregulator ArsR/SmtB family transcription factor [Enterococcus gallinarum]
MISVEQQQKTSDIFSILSSPTRLAILFFLFEREQANVSQIVSQVSISQSGVSYQLRILKEYHLVKSTREGKEMVYSLCDRHVISICEQILEHIQES